ncbi:RuvC [Chlamydia pneumoniae TW-183]|uniref:Crossover junction endodeoxyribonuclease RuvC n=2 Tax=Chlamydia pneumoniae TaxID=83558 RepID=RUVC_CHLPN|nr:crossover junction endodeoxyribonuclease RuvC [Chlamydia pneumoniae]Q9Z7T3.1 RecName: Full=Crossover junction endodeoxyribonuclease RuvC; AltName: Full=Holliday junction nuclease RuvC; AltName: Full=Holliday junction resolvase RuvC [Chlamydia pneumoniae]AAD18760.1 Crossover Junction Endonuclease [Chlamydia pneumoniae CWL029]AAF38009.1 Holliday junction resolvase [Chlamydia pneumoniae AR39]AAP98576.1 RuvC [Chlamydia pneumoniae TW-183]CRI33138.1 Crossover junction endodeoxyribonuclease RuvC [
MSELIIGVDPGTIVAGYAIIAVEQRYQLRPYSYGAIRLSSDMPLPMRYKTLFEQLSGVLDDTQPNAMVLETQFVNKNPQSTMKLAMARGIVLLAAAQRDILIFEYAPNVAKKAVVGKGHASKRQVQVMVSKILNVPEVLHPSNEDIADAFALAICHTHVARSPLCGVR